MKDVEEIQRIRTAQVADIHKDDAAALFAVGKTPVFIRKFNFWNVLAISVCVTGTVSSLPKPCNGTIVHCLV